MNPKFEPIENPISLDLAEILRSYIEPIIKRLSQPSEFNPAGEQPDLIIIASFPVTNLRSMAAFSLSAPHTIAILGDAIKNAGMKLHKESVFVERPAPEFETVDGEGNVASSDK